MQGGCDVPNGEDVLDYLDLGKRCNAVGHEFNDKE